VDENRHAESLIARILFLEGSPTVSKLNTISIGKAVKEMIANDHAAEAAAIKAYNEAIHLAPARGQRHARAAREDPEGRGGHIDWLEAQRDQIELMGSRTTWRTRRRRRLLLDRVDRLLHAASSISTPGALMKSFFIRTSMAARASWMSASVFL